MGDLDSFLALPRTNHTDLKARIMQVLAGGARSVGFIAHYAGCTYDVARATLREMLTEGYFQVVDVGDGDLRVTFTDPGGPVVDPDIYMCVLTAVRHAGARTIPAIAEQTGLPDTPPFRLAVALTARVAAHHRQEPTP